MTAPLRIGTRRSALALAQTEWVRARLVSHHPALQVEVVPMFTSGDRTRDTARRDDFTDTIDRALIDREVDLAVHSAKDLPSETPEGLVVAAYPRREDARDAFLASSSGSFQTLPRRARVGSSSARRRAQLLRRRPDLDIVEIRGNVDTRIERVRTRDLDAVVVAYAGLRRLGRKDEATHVFSTREMLPAPAQGALALATRRRDVATARILRPLDDGRTHACVSAERSFMAAMGGDCTIPLAAYAQFRQGRLRLRAAVYSRDGVQRLAVDLAGLSNDPSTLGRRAARELKSRGAQGLWVGESHEVPDE